MNATAPKPNGPDWIVWDLSHLHPSALLPKDFPTFLERLSPSIPYQRKELRMIIAENCVSTLRLEPLKRDCDVRLQGHTAMLA